MLEDEAGFYGDSPQPYPRDASAPESAQEKPGFRTKTIATRITSEELREVEAANRIRRLGRFDCRDGDARTGARGVLLCVAGAALGAFAGFMSGASWW